MRNSSVIVLIILFHGSLITAQITSRPKTLMESGSRDFALNRQHLLNPFKRKLPSAGGSEILHDSTFTYHWDSHAGDWRILVRDFYQYDSLGNNTVKLRQRWDNVKNRLTDFEKTIWTFDLSNMLREVLYLYWDTASGAWLKWYRQAYYDLNYGKVIDEDGQYWNTEQPSWTNDYRITRKFDEKGNLTELLIVHWNPETSVWRNYTRYFWTYNSDSYPKEFRYQRWNISQWSDIDKYIYRYNDRGEVTELLNQAWYHDWINRDKYTMLYDNNGNMLEYRYQDWNRLREVWIDQYLETYSYDGTGTLSNRLSQYVQGDNDNWINYRNEMYLFDDRGNKTEETAEYWDGKWINAYKILCAYDDYGNLTDSTDQYWEPFLEDWMNNIRSTMYYSAHTVITSADKITGNHDISAFPNPVRETIQFTYPPGKTVILEIYDATGNLRETLQDADEDGRSEVRFTGYKPGIYFFKVIHAGEVMYSGKVIRE